MFSISIVKTISQQAVFKVAFLSSFLISPQSLDWRDIEVRHRASTISWINVADRYQAGCCLEVSGIMLVNCQAEKWGSDALNT